ncbi:hypothetical protein ACHAXA_010589 [Cyclostephanos tholiformis]|uniref:Uncharacterized protein n=1 Tax=Cyclostephanos tholiformis TaxID=382380 RepID=A0ABD3RZF3_9STRA
METPSSITTAGQTDDSTTLISHSPLGVRRLNDHRRRGSITTATTSLRRRYRVLRSQIVLLLGSSAVFLLLFLFFALPFAAFASLLFVGLSVGALVPVATSMIRAQYELEMEHPLGLVRHLPESIRVMLTQTTLHEFMADTAFFMEYRYLLLYFIPGLRPEQLMEFIDRLPVRHREALLQPGLGRLMPSVMENFMRMDNDRVDVDWQLVGDVVGDDDGDSSASGLTMDREQQRGREEVYADSDGSDDAPVTLLEVVTGLRQTIVAFAYGATPTESTLIGRPAVIQRDGLVPRITNATPLNGENQEDGYDDDSFEFSVDLSAQGLTTMPAIQGMDEAPIVPAFAAGATASIAYNVGLRNVLVESQQLPNAVINHILDDPSHGADQQQQQEYDLEGIILSEAASAATAYYTAQATAAAIEAASERIVTTSSSIIRVGSWIGFITGSGGIVTAILADSRGLHLGSIGGADGRTDSASGAIAERRSRYVPAMYGFFATSALGFIGGDEEKQTNHLRQAKKVKSGESMALQDGEMINEGGDSPSFIPGLRALRGENDSQNWNHGSYAVASKRSGTIKLHVPQDTQIGDTLFLFLR